VPSPGWRPVWSGSTRWPQGQPVASPSLAMPPRVALTGQRTPQSASGGCPVLPVGAPGVAGVVMAWRQVPGRLPYAATASISSIPLPYWRILFPEPYWETIKTESAKNNLDPYLVASLIRQESEFNPSAVSYANAWGLMQLLPSVGKAMAREEGMSHFETYQLLDPDTNIRLGTRYLRHMLEHFGGVSEYALAAYNAGDERVADWEAAGPYTGMDEFVESIPFTQTREYVEAILRNIETYRAIDAASNEQSRLSAAR